MPVSGIADSVAFLSALPGGGELLLLLLLILILFGPRRLPDFARSLGRILAELRRAADDFKEQLMSAERQIDDDIKSVKEAADSAEDGNNDLTA